MNQSPLPTDVPATPCVTLVIERYMPQLHEAVMREGAARGWRMRFCCRTADGRLPILEDVDGLLVMLGTAEARAWAAAAPCPMVSIYSDPFGRTVPLVKADDQAIGRMGARHLLELGYQRLAFFRFFEGERGTVRRDSFAAEVKRAGREAILFDAPECDPPMDKNRVPRIWRERWLADQLRRQPMPLGLMVEADVYACEAVNAARLIGLRIPQDLAVLAAENMAADLASSPIPISAVDMNVKEMAKRAVALLARALAGDPPPDHWVSVVPPQPVLVRESTATFVSDIPGVADAVLHMRKHYREPILVDDLARKAKMSLRKLQSEVKHALGHTLRDELALLRLKHAEQLLRETDMKVMAIAVESGFGDKLNLYRAFMKYQGITPGSVRKNKDISSTK